MATETPTFPLPLASGTGETERLDLALPPRPDTLSVLDHRSRRQAIPRQLAPPGHYISLEDDDGAAHVLPLEGKIIHVGRAVASDLRFEDPRVSRRHAIIVRYGRHVRVLDDRSSTGTFVNGVRILATDLEDGDVVRIGPVAFTYTIVR